MLAIIILLVIIDVAGYLFKKSRLQHLPWYIRLIPFVWLIY
jgi:uncharacterized membrane protein